MFLTLLVGNEGGITTMQELNMHGGILEATHVESKMTG